MSDCLNTPRCFALVCRKEDLGYLLREAEIGISVMRRDTYKVLTSYIKNEKKNCQKIVLRKPFFFYDYDFLPLTANVLTVFRLTVNRLIDPYTSKKGR